MRSKQEKIIVSVKNLWKSFRTGDTQVTVLKNLSVDLYEGELIVLFGPSGCGKSTFLNTILGLEHPDKGSVNFMGMKIWDLSSDDRAVIRKKNIGTVYQQQNWLKSLDVVSNVALIGNLLGYSREKSQKLAEEKLKNVGISERTHYRPYELSSGEQQRISLARCLMNEPTFIVADEPTGNLDVKAGLEVLKNLKKLTSEGRTILMVSHGLESLDFADRILFMLDGKIRKDIKVKDSDINVIKRKITKDINTFIGGVEKGEDIDKDDQKVAPRVAVHKEVLDGSRKKFAKFLDFVRFNIVFTISMFLLLFLYVPSLVLDRFFLKKRGLPLKTKNFVVEFFSRLEGKKRPLQESISNWELGEISLAHLMEKKARTMITIFGVGFGVGFVTFLLSIGYGLESLVISEIARIEDRRQIVVTPTVNTEVVIDQEKYSLIGSVAGVKEMYPLINLATTIYYEGSQTDVVAYGVDPEYLDVTGVYFLNGEVFDQTKPEIVIGSEVLAMLGVDQNTVLDKSMEVKFIPVGGEREKIEVGEEAVFGQQNYNLEYIVAGVVSTSHAPIIYFPIADASASGVEDYSEVLLVLDEFADMAVVRKNIEALGMRTSSIMDTVEQVQSFFTYLRLSLLVIGIVAFFVAVLGMINTLTVSLMERTREVGLLKAVGMRTVEIKKLFITESMFIAFGGGVVGVSLGLLFGGFISLFLSMLSLSRGGEILIVSEIPFLLIFIIILVSVFIGFVTGLYPSRRAVRMSPLDALRYE